MPVPFIALGVGIAALVSTTMYGVFGIVGRDTDRREKFTQDFVTNASQQYPNHNVVIVHPAHRVSGNDYAHQHTELPITIGTIGYEIYFSPKGRPFEFVLEGDGGFINWAYSGNFNRNDHTLTAT